MHHSAIVWTNFVHLLLLNVEYNNSMYLSFGLFLYPLQVLIDTKVTAVNPADTYIRNGAYPSLPPLPYVVGVEGAGLVKAVGNDVTRFKVT